MATRIQSLYTSPAPAHATSQPPTFVDDFFAQYSSRPTRKSSPASPKQSMAHAYPRRNVFKRVVERVRLEYYRYEVTIGVYCMTWGEKWIFNSFVVFVLLLLVWALFFYFPSLLFHKVKRLGWLLTGRDATHANNFSLTWSNGRAIPTPMVTEAPAYT